ncbi:MAG: hypothetical protein IKS48_01570 [Eubacterium sp.]|nr:hypothetical protein [Eubacterium sp.]
MSRIQVKNIIVKRFGDRLLKNGLEYDDYANSCWSFSQKEDPFAIVHIDKYRFESNTIGLTVYNKYFNLIDSSNDFEIAGFDKILGGLFHYENEEELIFILEKMFDYLEASAIPKVIKDYNQKKTNNDEELNIQLYENHRKYYDEIISKYPDIYKETEGIHVDSLCEFIDRGIGRVRDLKDAADKEEFIKLAALLGTILEIEFSGEWVLVDFYDEKRVRIDHMKNGVGCYHMMTELLKIYRGETKIDAIRFMIDYMIETKK